MPKTFNVIITTFADDTTLPAIGNTLEKSKERLQAGNNVILWTKKRHVKLNETKSPYINFTNKRIDKVPISINDVSLQPTNTAKYLSMNLDVKLYWSEHVKKKVEELNNKF